MEQATIAGRMLEVERIAAGEPQMPTLIFLHEGLGSIAMWKRFPRALCASTGCGGIVYSRYGNGFSEVLGQGRSVDYMHHEACVVLPELLAAYGISSRDAILVGHSDGASIALLYAGEVASPRGLILEAPHVFVEERSVRSIAAAKVAFESGDLRARLAKYHADVDATFYGWNDVWLSAAFRSWNILSSSATIAAPTLLIQGVDDEYGTLAQIEAIAAALGADRFLAGRCGHAPHLDRFPETLNLAATFIRNTIEPPKAG
ncbi:MAG: alpha/beta fold hydrolase [Vulcanimicrobiaceae bacterium]